jgi:hypothetical protein
VVAALRAIVSPADELDRRPAGTPRRHSSRCWRRRRSCATPRGRCSSVHDAVVTCDQSTRCAWRSTPGVYDDGVHRPALSGPRAASRELSGRYRRSGREYGFALRGSAEHQAVRLGKRQAKLLRAVDGGPPFGPFGVLRSERPAIELSMPFIRESDSAMSPA